MNKVVRYISIIFFSSLLNIAVSAKDGLIGEGQVAPDFEIIQMDGTKFKLSDYRGKQAVYLVFWNTWCSYCVKKTPKLKEIQANLAEQIKIIAVNTGLKDSVKKSFSFQQQFDINYPLAFDHGKKITDLYGVWGTPTEFIIDINGIIQHRDGVPDEIHPLLAQWNSVIRLDKLVSNDNSCEEGESKIC